MNKTQRSGAGRVPAAELTGHAERHYRQIADAVRPTLGPLSKTVLIGREAGDQPPMFLTAAAFCIIELPNRDQATSAGHGRSAKRFG